MATIVLVHGMFHGGWCWELVTPLLEARGHHVLAPDTPGMGSDPTPLAEVGLDQWAGFVADLCRAQDEPVVLVGHSRGGIVISQAAELAPEALAGLVYVAAMLVPDGQTMLETTEALATGPRADLMPTIGEDGASLHLDHHSVATALYNLTPPELTERALARTGPEPLTGMAGRLSLSDARFGRVPRAYIECSEDLGVAHQLQRAMQAALPCDPVVTLATDHSPFYSDPEGLADAIDGIAHHFVTDAATSAA